MLRRTSQILSRIFLYGLPVSILIFIALAVLYLQNRPALSVWHEARLDKEFTAASDAKNFDDYLAIEASVFAQLDRQVYQRTRQGEEQRVNRYSRNSLSDPTQWPRNWNRSFQLDTENPKAGVLLLHGMSDSPYSLRTIGLQLNKQGARVIGLRYPGHGTAPSGLTRLRWEDMAAAVDLAVAQLKQQLGDKPVYIVGYSAGGALAVNHVLRALTDPSHLKVAGLILISLAIGVSSLAPLAVWQGRLGALLGLDKLEWSDIKPEYDPFKYNSFAVNAGDQMYRLTSEISRLMEVHAKAGDLDRLPPILAFQSSADATVSTPALIDTLFSRLPASGGHQLTLFDINREIGIEPLLRSDPKNILASFLAQDSSPFRLNIITNSTSGNPEAIMKSRGANQLTSRQRDIGIRWPKNVYSLSHIALPFSEDDPLYGPGGNAPENSVQLGNFASRGERGVLLVSAADMLRLRWNPFYSLMEKQILAFTSLE